MDGDDRHALFQALAAWRGILLRRYGRGEYDRLYERHYAALHDRGYLGLRWN